MGAFSSRARPRLSKGDTACIYTLLVLSAAVGVATIAVLWYSITNPRSLDPCQVLTCLNGGVCTAQDDYSATCVCAYGFLGERCALPGCAGVAASPPQTLWNQTVLFSAGANATTWIAPFMDGGATQKLWLVYANGVALWSGGPDPGPFIATSGRNNTWGLVCDGHSVLVGRGTCSGPNQPCILQVFQNGTIVPYVYSSDFAVPAGTAITVKSMNCALDFVYTAAPATTYWSTVANGARDISSAVGANDSVAAAAGTVFASNGTVLTYVYGVGDSIASSVLLQVVNQDPFPSPTDVSVVGIVGLSATESGTVWVVVKYLNWTTVSGPGIGSVSAAGFKLYHFGSKTEPLVSTGAYLPLIGGTLQAYGSVSGDLFLTDGAFVATQACNGLAPVACPDCGEAATCQGLTCQCLYPYFNGSFPGCADVDECAAGHLVGAFGRDGSSACGAVVNQVSVAVLICMNYAGGHGCHTCGAAMQSWLTAGRTVYPQDYGFSYQGTSFSPASERTRFVSLIFQGYEENPANFITTEIFESPDDRDFIVFVSRIRNDGLLMNPSFHLSNPDWAYSNCFPASGQGMCMFDVRTGVVISFMSTGATLCGGGFGPFTCDMIQQDTVGTVWATCRIYSVTSTDEWNLRLNETLSNPVGSCVKYAVPGAPGFCNKGINDLNQGIANCVSRPYTLFPIHEASSSFDWSESSSISLFPNYTVPSNPIIGATGPFAGSPAFGLPGYGIMSTSSRDDGSTINVVYRVVSSVLISPQILVADQNSQIISRISLTSGTVGDPAGVYTDQGNGCLFSSCSNQQLVPSYQNLYGLMYFPDLAIAGPCTVANGNCGGQYCVQTTTAGVARCDVCDRFTYPQSAAAIAAAVAPGFRPVRVYSDPFLRGPLATPKALFLAGTASVLYRVQLSPAAAAAASPVMTFTNVPVAFPPFGFAMSQDTHASLIYVIAKRYTTGSPDTRVVACVNFARTFIVDTLNASRLNFTGATTPVTYDVRGLTFDRTRVLWIIACMSTSCYMSKWYANFTLIATQQLPGGPDPYRLSAFQYDRKTLIFTAGGTTAVSYRYMGGADYARQYWSDVLIGPDSIQLIAGGGGGNFTAIDSTQFGFVGLVTPVTYQSSLWTSVSVFDPFGSSWQVVPLVMNVQNGHVVSTDSVVQIHFSGWGSLYYVTDSGNLGVVGCAGSPLLV